MANKLLKKFAYAFAGLAMMLNIRLSYSAAPFALLRFKLPENLFSVFVRRMASALELWCLPSMLLGNIMDLFQKYYFIYFDSMLQTKATSLKDEVGDKSGGTSQNDQKLWYHADQLYGKASTLATAVSNNAHLTEPLNELKKAVGANDGVYGKLQQALKNLGTDDGNDPQDQKSKAIYVINAYTNVNFAYQEVKNLESQYKEALSTLPGGNQQPYNDVENEFTQLESKYTSAIGSYDPHKWKRYIIKYPSIVTQWLNFLTYVILWIVYIMGGDQGRLTLFYLVIAISGVVFGINMVLLYGMDYFQLVYYMVGENSFPIVTSAILYFAKLIFGNRRKWNSDYIIVGIDIWAAIMISFVAAAVWTYLYCSEDDYPLPTPTNPPEPEVASPALMVIVGMGLVYAIYPGIAPGMIVPFYLIDRIEMVLLIATAFPPITIAILRQQGWTAPQSPTCKWSSKNYGGPGTHWHAFDLLIVLKITLAGIFIYSLHYKDSSLSRSIVNQPKMSTALSIIFYMCHESLLAIGFPGIFGDNNGGDIIMLPAQYVGALFMIFLAFYSEGYIIEYKSHDPSQWPTEGMTRWNALCYWTKRATKITNLNMKSLFQRILKLFTFFIYF